MNDNFKDKVNLIDPVREAALKILYDINENGAYSNLAVDKYFGRHEFGNRDRSFATDLVYGAIKWKLTLDWVLGQFSDIKLKKLSPWILNILRMGIFQLLFTDRIPASAACDESVRLSKKYGHHASAGYVNAVLRSIDKNRNNIRYPDRDYDFITFLSIKYSYPEWLIKKWINCYGPDFTENLMEYNSRPPEFSIRVNRLKTTKQEIVEKLNESGFETRDGKYVDEAVIIGNPVSFTGTDIFKKGFCQIQDESPMLATIILDPKPGELIIDVCSAPGGKTAHIAELMNNKGTIIARDIHEHKVKLVSETAERLGIGIIRAEVFDAAVFDKRYEGAADRVLVDVPCTGLGIIRRKPDIKWTRNYEDIYEIIKLQKQILATASRYLKRGGILVYSTCTIGHEENEDVIKDFLYSVNDFEMSDMTSFLPGKMKKISAADGYVQLFPNIDGTDGFFIARMVRKS